MAPISHIPQLAAVRIPHAITEGAACLFKRTLVWIREECCLFEHVCESHLGGTRRRRHLRRPLGTGSAPTAFSSFPWIENRHRRIKGSMGAVAYFPDFASLEPYTEHLAMIVLPVLTFALSAVVVKALPLAIPSPPPTPTGAIDIGQCLSELQCCQSTFSLAALPSDIANLIPGLPLPTLGPMVGVVCSSITDLNPLGNQCLNGGKIVCCEQVLPCM
ncbi:hypothetical protein C8Q80DRAFT_189773 [Daedaleopsis nitida]|nr:hypothetical protein C8Q80DRAFT_189773 [Daedaleopsis nitida]